VSAAVAGLCAAAAGVAGAFVPVVVRRLPEPAPEPASDPAPEPASDPAPEPETPSEDTGPDQDAAETTAAEPVRKPKRPLPDFSLWGMHAQEREKEPYRELADVPHLALGCAIASALVGALLGWKFGWYPILALVIPPIPVCVAIAVVDWRTRYIPSWLVLPATAYAVVAGLVLWAAVGDRTDLVRGVVGLAVVRSFFWVMWFIRAAGMGFGDVRLAALLGFVLGYLGWGQLIFGVWIGFIAFGLPGILVSIAKRDLRLLRVPFPFGPFMLIGALVGVFLGQPVMNAIYG
jgi:leader peptidase (prepilin peptidase)/N-methyltransferase